MSYESPYENVPRSSSETTAIALVVFMAVLRGLQILLTFVLVEEAMRNVLTLIVAGCGALLSIWGAVGMAQRKLSVFRTIARIHGVLALFGAFGVVMFLVRYGDALSTLMSSAPLLLAIIVALPVVVLVVHVVGYFVTSSAANQLERTLV